MSHSISSTTNINKTFSSDLRQQILDILHHCSNDRPIYEVRSKYCNDLNITTFKDNILKTPFHRQYWASLFFFSSENGLLFF